MRECWNCGGYVLWGRVCLPCVRAAGLGVWLALMAGLVGYWLGL